MILADEMMPTIERKIAMAFVDRNKKRRVVELLSSKRGRAKFLTQLPHFRDFDPEVMIPIVPKGQTPEQIEDVLRKLGAPSRCYVISEKASLDGNEIDLSTALIEVVGSGLGTILSCVPGELAFFEGEEAGDRFLLRRPRRR